MAFGMGLDKSDVGAVSEIVLDCIILVPVLKIQVKFISAAPDFNHLMSPQEH